ncbi:MAG: prepilin-type N-terminal cleavage/methylation domain-containing protein [Gemmatimonadaceae bacterium]
MHPRAGTLPSTSRHGSSAGFTLIEVMVTVAVMALVASLALPAFVPPRREADTVATTLRAAADLAVRRAQWVTLRVTPDGAWNVRGDLDADTAAFAAGRLMAAIPAPLIVRLSPLGACLTGDASGDDPCQALRPGVVRHSGAER